MESYYYLMLMMMVTLEGTLLIRLTVMWQGSFRMFVIPCVFDISPELFFSYERREDMSSFFSCWHR
jgi:hypothetical protein